jgi:putative transposase
MDFKYIKILNKTYYLFKIIDDRSRLDICSSLVERATTKAAIELLEKAMKITGTKPILLKTDRGSQFRKMFGKKLERLGIYHLKSIPYFPKCNAKIERVFRDVEANVCKNLPYNIVYEEVKQLLDNESVRHNESPHMSLNGLSPKAFYKKFMEIQSSIKNGFASIVEKIEECKMFKTFKRVVRKVADFIPGTKIDVNVITYQM